MLCFYLLIAVQILLESFPVSSSGHVALFRKFSFLPLCDAKKFLSCEPLQHLLHGPTILILSLFFLSRWKSFFTASRFSWKKLFNLLFFIGCADFFTTVFYFTFKYFGKDWFPSSLGFLITALSLFSLLILHPSIHLDLLGTQGRRDFVEGYRKLRWIVIPIILGIIQGISLLPGISRFASTFVAARWMGFSPRRSFEFSFLIQWPLLVGAFVKSIIFFSRGNCPEVVVFLFRWQTLLVVLISSLGAFYALWLVQQIAYRKKLWIFSIYLLIPFVLVFFFL